MIEYKLIPLKAVEDNLTVLREFDFNLRKAIVNDKNVSYTMAAQTIEVYEPLKNIFRWPWLFLEQYDSTRGMKSTRKGLDEYNRPIDDRFKEEEARALSNSMRATDFRILTHDRIVEVTKKIITKPNPNIDLFYAGVDKDIIKSLNDIFEKY